MAQSCNSVNNEHCSLCAKSILPIPHLGRQAQGKGGSWTVCLDHCGQERHGQGTLGTSETSNHGRQSTMIDMEELIISETE